MRVAVVGTGSVGRRHLANLVALGIDVLAVSEHRRLGELELGDARVAAVPSLDLALADADAVVVANPSSLHLETARRAVAAERHVLLEKPAHVTATGLAELQHEAAARGVVVAVVQQIRFHPLVARLRELVHGGDLGSLLTVEGIQGEHLADHHPDEDYRIGYAARRELGGGVLLTQIHLLDLLVWILGRPDAAFAVGGHHSDLEIDVEDTASFLLRFGDGRSAYGHVDYLRRPKHFTVAVAGERGSAAFDLHASTLHTQAGDADAAPTREHVAVARNDLFVEVLVDFFDAVHGDHAPCCPLADAIDVLRVVDAIKTSMVSGRAEPISEL
jgi:predicted dehydrogenase